MVNGNQQLNMMVLNMATDLRHQLQELHRQVDTVVECDGEGHDNCMSRQLVNLFSSVNLSQTLSLELVHRLSAHIPQSMVCPKDCHRHCPWPTESQRIDRWNKDYEIDHETHRLAIYDFQRGITMAVTLADYFESSFQQLAEDEPVNDELRQVAFCLSSWVRKLVQLLSHISASISCPNISQAKYCANL
jgi:hypothetical protein